jgi:hypothetical protein
MSDVSSATTAPRREISQEATEFAVAALVLDEHPGTLTEAEVIKHLCRGRPEQENTYYESIRELIGAGVLHLEGARLHASEPVLRLARVAEIP